MNLSDQGITLLTQYEELHLDAYIAEPNGTIYTVGYGSYNRPGVTAGTTITEAQAEQWLREDIAEFENHVSNVVDIPLTQNQFDALVLFAFNTGAGANDSVWREINAENFDQAMNEMAGWRNSNGEYLRGLSARRNDEIELFMGGNATREYNYDDHFGDPEALRAFIKASILDGLNNETLSIDEVFLMINNAAPEFRQILSESLRESDQSCFGAGTPVDMWPLDKSLKPGPDGVYNQEAVSAKIWKKPIELIEVGDTVVSFDDNGNMVPGHVPRTFQNEVKILLNFFGTRVTPGHVYYRADSKKAHKFETLIDVLRDDGVIQKQDGTLIRAATNVPVGDPRDGFVKASTGTRRSDGSLDEKDQGRIRLGTRFIIGEGEERKHWAVADVIKHAGGVVDDDEMIRVGDGPPMAFHWEFGDTLPKPEDFVLETSGTTLEDIYKAAEWESQQPQMPAPMVMDGGPIQPLSHTTLNATPRNEPLNLTPTPAAKPRQALNRKQRKAMEAKQRKAGKMKRVVS